MKPIQIKGNTYILPGAVHVGVIVGEAGACIAVDSGLDATAGKKLLRSLDEAGLTLKAIVNTHAHADHIGGNALLQARTGAQCYASPVEAAMARCTELEGLYLYTALPPAPLQTKFLRAEATPQVEDIAYKLSLCGVALELLPLRGHSPGHTGVLSPDGVLFVGDAIMSEAVWEKYALSYMVDVAHALDTLQRLHALAGQYIIVAAHIGVVDEAQRLIAYNRDMLLRRLDEAREFLREPMTREQLTAAFARKYALKPDLAQSLLLYSTVSAYVAYLHQSGQAEMYAQDGLLIFEAK